VSISSSFLEPVRWTSVPRWLSEFPKFITSAGSHRDWVSERLWEANCAAVLDRCFHAAINIGLLRWPTSGWSKSLWKNNISGIKPWSAFLKNVVILYKDKDSCVRWGRCFAADAGLSRAYSFFFRIDQANKSAKINCKNKQLHNISIYNAAFLIV